MYVHSVCMYTLPHSVCTPLSDLNNPIFLLTGVCNYTISCIFVWSAITLGIIFSKKKLSWPGWNCVKITLKLQSAHKKSY